MEIPWKEEIYQPARKLQSLDEKRICTKFARGKWIWYQGRKDGNCHNLPPNLKPRVNWYAKGAFTIFADQFAQIWYDTAMNNFFRPVNIYHLLTESEVITGKSSTEASLSLDDNTSRPGPEISQ